ncbi:MAG: hypothetical protein JSS86_11020 [Cyanobacteria bacterium SZAS LIN-2]|nr:hypothetical protein [Cyanobacteria bacterium SZAS LIN-3]MBS1996837.1 hypothetical protein [Cyanobacteria bacterium SZAS LIN-2]
MVEDFDQALEVDVLACSLQMDKDENGDLLEFLATKLSGAMPQETEVTRGGWMLSSKKPVVGLAITLGEVGFQMVREKNGHLTARQMKIVRGVTLSTKEVPPDKWVQDLAEALSRLAEKNSKTKEALKKFVIG